MPYSVFAIANAMIDRAVLGRLDGLTPRKLQNLLYLAQGWYMKTHSLSPLFEEEMHRWQSGPVAPMLLQKLKALGSEPIARMVSLQTVEQGLFVPVVPFSHNNAWEFIDSVVAHYGPMSENALTEITTSQRSAWALGLPDGSVISAHEIMNDEAFLGQLPIQSSSLGAPISLFAPSLRVAARSDESMPLKNEVWMVIQKRRDGTLPNPVKMMFAEGKQGLHFTEDDAVQAMEAINEELSGEFAGVFRCSIEVLENCTPKPASLKTKP
jgi:uncharacterized phage-associated protein